MLLFSARSPTLMTGTPASGPSAGALSWLRLKVCAGNMCLYMFSRSLADCWAARKLSSSAMAIALICWDRCSCTCLTAVRLDDQDKKPIRAEKTTAITSKAMMAMAVASGKFLMRKVTLLLAGRRWRTGAAPFFCEHNQTDAPVVLV